MLRECGITPHVSRCLMVQIATLLLYTHGRYTKLAGYIYPPFNGSRGLPLGVSKQDNARPLYSTVDSSAVRPFRWSGLTGFAHGSPGEFKEDLCNGGRQATLDA